MAVSASFLTVRTTLYREAPMSANPAVPEPAAVMVLDNALPLFRLYKATASATAFAKFVSAVLSVYPADVGSFGSVNLNDIGAGSIPIAVPPAVALLAGAVGPSHTFFEST